MVDSNLAAYILGPAGAAGLCLLLVLLGILVPKPYHDKVVKENERLQETNDRLIAANEALREANRNLSVSGNLTNEVMSALLSLASGRQSGVAPPQVPPQKSPSES